MPPFELVIWFVVNIVVPVLAPLVLPLILKIPPKTRPFAKGLVLKSVIDGQLFWVVIALCAVECYELFGYLEHAPRGWQHHAAVTAIGFHVLLIGFSMILVLAEALELPLLAANQQGHGGPLAPDRTVLNWSIASTVLVAATFTFAHNVVVTAENAEKSATLEELAKAKESVESYKRSQPAEKERKNELPRKKEYRNDKSCSFYD